MSTTGTCMMLVAVPLGVPSQPVCSRRTCGPSGAHRPTRERGTAARQRGATTNRKQRAVWVSATLVVLRASGYRRIRLIPSIPVRPLGCAPLPAGLVRLPAARRAGNVVLQDELGPWHWRPLAVSVPDPTLPRQEPLPAAWSRSRDARRLLRRLSVQRI